MGAKQKLKMRGAAFATLLMAMPAAAFMVPSTPMRPSVSKTTPLVTRSSVSVMNAEKEFKEVFEVVVNAVPIVVPSLVVGAIALDALLPSGILKVLDEDGGVASIG